MSRILLAWELGGNYGHLGKLALLTRALKDKGHNVVLAVRDPASAGKFFDRSEATFIQAPMDGSFGKKRQPASFTDILANCGFGNADRLEELVRGWHGIFDSYRPEVVVAEYAPSTVFSARLFNIPCLRMDTGFAIPPDVSPWPCFRPWLKLRREQLLHAETTLLATVNKIRTVYGQPAHTYLYESVRADITLLATVPELDHYPGRKGARYIGPLLNQDNGVEIDWPDGSGPRVFVYLRVFAGLKVILEGLRQSSSRAIVVVPEIRRELSEQFTGSGLTISDQPAILRSILPEADLVISHAGHGLTSAAMLAGVPTLALPTQIEQMMLTKALERHGIGVGLSRNDMRSSVSGIISKMACDQSLQERVRCFAEKYRDYDAQKTIDRLVNTIERLPAAMNIRRAQRV